MSALPIVAVSTTYAVAGLITARLTAGHLAWTFKSESYRGNDLKRPDTAQWFGAGCVGVLCGVVWPLVLVWRCVPSRRWAFGAEQAAIAQHSKERIAALERELDLR